jgi:hypothetical protein
MSKQKMREAQGLIKEKRYDDARKLLRTVEHPTAKDWLKKLDQLDPPKKQTSSKPKATAKASASRSSSSSNLDFDTILIGAIVVVAIIAVGVLVVALSGGGGGGSTELTQRVAGGGVEVSHPAGWVNRTETQDGQPVLILASSQDVLEAVNAEDPTVTRLPSDAGMFVISAIPGEGIFTATAFMEFMHAALGAGEGLADGLFGEALGGEFNLNVRDLENRRAGDHDVSTFAFESDGQWGRIAAFDGDGGIIVFAIGAVDGNLNDLDDLFLPMLGSVTLS